MVKVSNRTKKNRQKVEIRNYKAIEALNLLKDTATAKFNEIIDESDLGQYIWHQPVSHVWPTIAELREKNKRLFIFTTT